MGRHQWTGGLELAVTKMIRDWLAEQFTCVTHYDTGPLIRLEHRIFHLLGRAIIMLKEKNCLRDYRCLFRIYRVMFSVCYLVAQYLQHLLQLKFVLLFTVLVDSLLLSEFHSLTK